ncbi:hypothetical protein [Pseudomonas syringae]|uniref:hypothetical protein n=1 Tax=Pseudomonas syringae TaxID=317 RepID=UPI001F2D5E87|nr:hypothetical protein [Pseudomonas syringae]MBL3832643.1 hypothetical protein [Pseudomonas syringae pv. theae]MBL3837864.1 hypothetical protein [Pseudomonas syringae pv. theae]MBL3865819.1 hypothetical protein [Pseudomonas syringae pv. theae]GKQ49050.1 hypothetical protein PSTH2693_27860 [Pseudomonas syringae pv. theae]
MRALIFAAAIALLMGCGNKQQERPEIEAAKAQQAVADDAQCQSYGVKPGSDAYVGCRMQLDSRRAQSDEIRRQRALQMLINGQQPQKVYQMPAQTNCTSTTYGQTTNTNCR